MGPLAQVPGTAQRSRPSSRAAGPDVFPGSAANDGAQLRGKTYYGVIFVLECVVHWGAKQGPDVTRARHGDGCGQDEVQGPAPSTWSGLWRSFRGGAKQGPGKSDAGCRDSDNLAPRSGVPIIFVRPRREALPGWSR